MSNDRSDVPSSTGQLAEPSMYEVNLSPPGDLGEAMRRVFAREHRILRRPGAFRTYVVGTTFAVHLIDGAAPADLDGALLVALRGLDDEERFAAVVYVSGQSDGADGGQSDGGDGSPSGFVGGPDGTARVNTLSDDSAIELCLAMLSYYDARQGAGALARAASHSRSARPTRQPARRADEAASPPFATTQPADARAARKRPPRSDPAARPRSTRSSSASTTPKCSFATSSVARAATPRSRG